MTRRRRKQHKHTITLADKNNKDKFPDSISGYKPPESKNKKSIEFYQKLLVRRLFIQRGYTYRKLCEELNLRFSEIREMLSQVGFQVLLDSKISIRHAVVIAPLILSRKNELKKYEEEIISKHPKLHENYFKLIYSGR